MPIYLPKNIVPLIPRKSQPIFFLAGPVRGGGDWQADMALQMLGRNPATNIAIPCRWNANHRLAHLFVTPFTRDAPHRQLHWERHYMEHVALSVGACCLVFWLGLESATSPHPGPEPYAMDTRREIGKWTAWLKFQGAKLVVGADPSFYGLSVIQDELNDAYGKPFHIYQSMEEVVTAAFGVTR